ncbi:hypothetical protein [Nocardia sp. NPDC047038]
MTSLAYANPALRGIAGSATEAKRVRETDDTHWVQIVAGLPIGS